MPSRWDSANTGNAVLRGSRQPPERHLWYEMHTGEPTDGRTPIIPSPSRATAMGPMAETNIPVPDSSANSGQQEASHEVLPPIPQLGLPVIDTIERGLATSPIAIDGFTSALISSVTRQLGHEIEALRSDKAQLQRALDARRDELENERRCNAVLTERLDSDRGNRHLRHVGIALGTSMASAGIFGDLAAGPGGLPILLVAGGILLALVSWLSPRQGKRTARKGNAS